MKHKNNDLPSLKVVRQRASRAWDTKRRYKDQLDEIYEYIIPYRDAASSYGQSEGQRRMNRVFDSTAIKAAFRFPGRLQRDVTPPHQDYIKLTAGPMVPEDERKSLNEELAKIAAIVQAVLRGGEFSTSSHEAFLELFAGTGALLMEEGEDFDPVEFICVPMQELALELGPRGRKVSGIYWKKKYRYDQLKELWPEGKFSSDVLEKISEGSTEEIEITQYTFQRPKERDYQLLVWAGETPKSREEKEQDGDYIHTRIYRTNPWAVFRFFVIPGETYGRGPAHIALPFVKTLNMTQELALRAASFAVTPAWLTLNQGGINPDTARLVPGNILKVNRTGGPMGSALERLPIPQDFDVSTFIMKDQREQVKEALHDSALPDAAGSVRSPTEIIQRMQALVQDLEGAYGRLIREFLLPVVRRVVDILERRGDLRTNLKFEELLLTVSVTSPIAQAQGADKVRVLVEWLQMTAGLMGPEGLQIMARMDAIIPEIGRMLGVGEEFIASREEQEQTRKSMAEQQQAQVEGEAQAKAAAKTEAENAGPPDLEQMLGVPLQ